MIRYALAYLRWAITRLSYVIRPYDMLADNRRWFWRPRTPHIYLDLGR